MRLEIHAGDGGTDAELFASELAAAISKHSGAVVETDGRVLVFSRL